jgi:hypothetical protein
MLEQLGYRREQIGNLSDYYISRVLAFARKKDGSLDLDADEPPDFGNNRLDRLEQMLERARQFYRQQCLSPPEIEQEVARCREQYHRQRGESQTKE